MYIMAPVPFALSVSSRLLLYISYNIHLQLTFRMLNGFLTSMTAVFRSILFGLWPNLNLWPLDQPHSTPTVSASQTKPINNPSKLLKQNTYIYIWSYRLRLFFYVVSVPWAVPPCRVCHLIRLDLLHLPHLLSHPVLSTHKNTKILMLHAENRNLCKIF